MNNSNNDLIKKIYLLNDQIYDLNFIKNIDKIKQIVVEDDSKKRLKYKCAIEFINKNLAGELCVMANSDIYFDDSLKHLNGYNMTNKLLALSRYDNGILFNNVYSQDSWFFKSPLNVNLNKVDFCFGIPGCDNSFAHITHSAGYKISNPSLTIKTHHLHKSNYRTYSREKVPGPYIGIEPHNIHSQPKIMNLIFK